MKTKQAIERMLELARVSDTGRPQRRKIVAAQEVLDEVSAFDDTTGRQLLQFMESLPDGQLRAIVTLVYWARGNGREDIRVLHESLTRQPREYAAQMVAWKTLKIAEYLETALRLAEEAGLDYEAALCSENVER